MTFLVPPGARGLAAQLVYQVVHLAAMRVCDGKDPSATLDTLRADLHELVPLERLSLSEWLSLELRIRNDGPTSWWLSPRLVITAADVVAGGGPNKWAAQSTGWLLGH